MIDLTNLTKNGKLFMLAYDQGLEHGPVDFNEFNCLPENILEIADKGGASLFACHKGIAEKYYTGSKYQTKFPLVLKMNGKTSYIKDIPYSPMLATVDEAVELGASAVGYTVFIGSPRQDEMFREFAELVHDAHQEGLAVIGWMYPSIPDVGGESPAFSAYAARIGMELGADIVKVKSFTDIGAMKWVTKAAGRTKVVFKGGEKTDEQTFLDQIRINFEADGFGLAVGRNIWQAENPLEVCEKINDIINEFK